MFVDHTQEMRIESIPLVWLKVEADLLLFKKILDESFCKPVNYYINFFHKLFENEYQN